MLSDDRPIVTQRAAWREFLEFARPAPPCFTLTTGRNSLPIRRLAKNINYYQSLKTLIAEDQQGSFLHLTGVGMELTGGKQGRAVGRRLPPSARRLFLDLGVKMTSLPQDEPRDVGKPV